jgi:cytochrome c-type biogenesis protein CcmH
MKLRLRGGLKTAASLPDLEDSDMHAHPLDRWRHTHVPGVLGHHCARPHLRAVVAMLAALVCAAASARAVEPGEMLEDPVLEARARRLSQELRCVVCQNQSIDESNAPLAHDLRVIVRERLLAGDSDAHVLAFVEARYGEFVLLRPRFKPQTLLLWLAPPLLLVGAAIFLLRARSRRAAAPQEAALSRDEQRRLDELLRTDGRR